MALRQSLPRSPTRGRTLAAMVLIQLFLLFFHATGRAATSCTFSAQLTTPGGVLLTVSSPSAQTPIGYGQLQVVAQCTGSNDHIDLESHVDSAILPLKDIPGISVQLAGAAAYNVARGSASDTCSYIATGSYFGGTRLDVAFNLINTVSTTGCTFTVVLMVHFYQTASVTSGTYTLGPDMISSSQNGDNCPGFKGWAGSYVNSVGNSCPGTLPLGGNTITVANVAHTCSVNSPTVTLPTIAASAFTASPAAARTPFTLTLNGCDHSGASYDAMATWNYYTSTGLPGGSQIANTASSSPAANVFTQILDSSQNPISDGTTTRIAHVPQADPGGTTYSATYYAQYYSAGNPGPGNVTGIAYLTLSYQ